MHIKLSKTLKLFIASIIMIAGLAGVYVFFFVAMRDKVDQAAAATTQIEDLSGKDARIETTLAILKKQAPIMDKVSASFIKESEIVAFTKTIEGLGPQSSTTVAIQSLEPGTGDKGISVLNIRLTAAGSLKNVLALITLLENFPARFDWNSVHLSVTNDGTITTSTGVVKRVSAPQWSADISLTALNFIKE